MEAKWNESPADRASAQASGTHPAPCARMCEARAFEIEIRTLKARLATAEQGARRYEVARMLSPRDFAELHRKNLVGEGQFDDLVDALVADRAAKQCLHLKGQS
jgi:hypothetical protein